MDHVLFEAVQTVQPRQKRSSTLDAAPPTPSQIGANLSRERQLMAASGEAVGVVTALRSVRTSHGGDADAAGEPARLRRTETPPVSLDPDSRLNASAAAAAAAAATASTSAPLNSSGSSLGSSLQLLVSVFYSPPEDDVKASAQRFADSVLAEFCRQHGELFLSSRLTRLLRSCETTEDQAELKKLQRQIAKKFTVFDVHIGVVERACAADAPTQAKTLKRFQFAS